MDRFKTLGAEVSYYDPHVPEIGPTREHAKWQGVKSIAWVKETVTTYDAVVIATNHKAVNLSELAAWVPLVIDTRNAMTEIQGIATVVKA
jgi:UDP-N-acetyl-D-glucosamine dehydrogenase